MDTTTIERALEALGEALSYPTDVELLLVGGAAGMLTGVLPPARTTTDCDVMSYEPSNAMAAVESAAEQVAATLELPSNWLNSDVQIRRDTLPDAWRCRRVWIGAWGRLRVYAVSRPDLLAMKVLAGRAQDMDDIHSMVPRPDEIEFVRRYLDTLAPRGTHASQIDDARALLESISQNNHG